MSKNNHKGRKIHKIPTKMSKNRQTRREIAENR